MNYFFRRLGFYLLAFIIAITINFILPRVMPGDPMQAFLADLMKSGSTVDPDFVKTMQKIFGYDPDMNLFVSYLNYIKNIFSGNWGISFKFYPEQVFTVLGDATWWTVYLLGVSIIIAWTINTFLGIYVAWNRGSKKDSTITIFGIIMGAIPYVVTAMTLYFFLGVYLEWFPEGQAYDIDLDPPENFNDLINNFSDYSDYLLSIINHSILPITSMVLVNLGGIMGMRSNMINQLGEDFIVMGHAKGLTNKQVMFNYGARNAMVPQITAFTMSLGTILGGSMITEIIFNYPGLGFTTYQALVSRDYPLIQGYLLMMSIVILSANLVSDFILFWVDPRIRFPARSK